MGIGFFQWPFLQCPVRRRQELCPSFISGIFSRQLWALTSFTLFSTALWKLLTTDWILFIRSTFHFFLIKFPYLSELKENGLGRGANKTSFTSVVGPTPYNSGKLHKDCFYFYLVFFFGGGFLFFVSGGFPLSRQVNDGLVPEWETHGGIFIVKPPSPSVMRIPSKHHQWKAGQISDV